MESTLVLVIALFVQLVVVGGLLLIQPFIVRRGLLFGVYVGEERWGGDEARSLVRRWTMALVAAMGTGLALAALVVALDGPVPLAVLVSVVTQVVASYGTYLWAHFGARQLAAPGAPPAAAAALVADGPGSLLLPVASLAVAAIGGAIAVAYAWMHYAALPAQVPTHFGPSGRPDAWSPKSFGSVMMLPLTTLLLGMAMGGMAILTARAKRAIRYPGGSSIEAQRRFRRAMANFLAGVVVLMTAMLSGMSVYAVRTGLGLAAGMPGWLMAFIVVMLVYAVGGTLYLAFRYGQGGARLERKAAAGPLTNGLADNSQWVLGVFYVNRDDPSIFVEKRFGLGYTVNFGNPKAVALFVALLVVIAAIVISGLTTPQTR